MTAVKRTCLRCNQEFDSTGPGNRLCNLCNRANASESLRSAHQPLSSQDKQVESRTTRIRRSQIRVDE